MKNYRIKGEDGNWYWVHRAIAISAFVFKTDIDNNYFILANKRGKGTPDFQGMWNCPCGYLDWDETLAQACSREVKEECGIDIPSNKFIQLNINDAIDANLQNVTVRHFLVLSHKDNTEISIGTDGETNEVEEVAWISVKNIDDYQWAFGHDKIIKKLI